MKTPYSENLCLSCDKNNSGICSERGWKCADIYMCSVMHQKKVKKLKRIPDSCEYSQTNKGCDRCKYVKYVWLHDETYAFICGREQTK